MPKVECRRRPIRVSRAQIREREWRREQRRQKREMRQHLADIQGAMNSHNVQAGEGNATVSTMALSFNQALPLSFALSEDDDGLPDVDIPTPTSDTECSLIITVPTRGVSEEVLKLVRKAERLARRQAGLA